MHTIKVQSPDGTSIAVDVSGAGPALVLLHGSLVLADYWDAVLPALAEHFTVYAVERRGRGRSPAASHTLEREREDATAVIESIGAPVHLLGHSWGAVVALLAAQVTTNIARLILYEPPLPLVAPVVSGERLAEAHLLGERGDWVGSLRVALRSVGIEDGYPESDVDDSPISWPAMVRSMPSWLPELDECVALSPDPNSWVVAQETLVLVGTEHPQRTMQKLLCVQRNARIWSLPGQGHEAPITAPSLFASEVIRFLAT
ncbi:MAG TPA: alpha/beta hydrolase [Candidatus Eisenbacteria bacterium]|nr:alpha/beta hydrolase [Candidatus Eisenbacteria bacterium]